MGCITGASAATARYGLIGARHRTDDQAKRRHPRRIPTLHSIAAHRALKAVHFAPRRHRVRSVINRSALASSVLIVHGGAVYDFL
jgi:hypothetical protein